MPHLSPLSWALATIIFWFSFMNLITLMWWSQAPKVALKSYNSSFKFNKWNWN